MIKNFCIDCGKKISKKAKRCGKCAGKKYSKRFKGENNPNYIDGKTLRKNYCIDCKKEINYKARRCCSCENKRRFKKGILNIRGKNNPKYNKGYLVIGENNPNYRHGRYIENYCMDCGGKISPAAKRCNTCAHKGENNSSYKDGKTLRKNCCIDCGKQINYKATRCVSCSDKYKWKNGKYDNISRYFSIRYETKSGKMIRLDSSWELKIAQNLDKNNINWLRPNSKNGHTFQWIDKNGKQHTYYPDFYLIDYDVYLDPKNDYFRKNGGNDKIKRVREQNNVKVLILDEKELDWKLIHEKIFM